MEVAVLGGATVAVTDADGLARVTLAVDADPGVAGITATYAGEPGYRPARATAPFRVLAEGTTLSYLGDLELRGSKISLAARLTEDDGPPLAGRTVVFELAGRSATATTDADGLASLELRLEPGARPEEQLTVRFTGEVRFSESDTSVTLRVRSS